MIYNGTMVRKIEKKVLAGKRLSAAGPMRLNYLKAKIFFSWAGSHLLLPKRKTVRRHITLGTATSILQTYASTAANFAPSAGRRGKKGHSN